jgi:hypothetical protein
MAVSKVRETQVLRASRANDWRVERLLILGCVAPSARSAEQTRPRTPLSKVDFIHWRREPQDGRARGFWLYAGLDISLR